MKQIYTISNHEFGKKKTIIKIIIKITIIVIIINYLNLFIISYLGCGETFSAHVNKFFFFFGHQQDDHSIIGSINETCG